MLHISAILSYIFFISYLPEIMHSFIVIPNEILERLIERNQ